MKKLMAILYLSVALIVLVGCKGNTTKKSITEPSGNDSTFESVKVDITEKNESMSSSKIKESDTEDANDIPADESVNSDQNSTFTDEDKEGKEGLFQFTSEQIEYARVWLQLGPNQEIDELNIRHIFRGEPINPNDDTSAKYPKDVIQLAGSRLVDGSVTYSGNGGGTINVYNVPLRWDSNDSANSDEKFMQEYTKEIIEKADLLYVDPGEDKEIIKLIGIQNIQ